MRDAKRLWMLIIFGPAGMVALALILFLVALLPIAAVKTSNDNNDEVQSAGNVVTRFANDKVPKEYQEWVIKAGRICKEAPPQLIAAQIDQESGWNPRAHNDSSGADGLSQFTPDTWKTRGKDDDGNGKISPYDAGDAIMAQGRFDCALAKQVQSMMNGTFTEYCKKQDSDAQAMPPPKAGEIHGREVFEYMLAAYNAGPCRVAAWRGIPPFPETQNYVVEITQKMAEYAVIVDNGQTTADIEAVISIATQQIGKPYTQGTQGPNDGFDCSGLVQYSFDKGTKGDVRLPRTTFDQVNEGAAIDPSGIRRGDLIFFGFKGPHDHVGIYLGDNKMVHADNPQKGIKIEDIGPGSGPYANTSSHPWTVRRIISLVAPADGGTAGKARYVLPVSDYALGAAFGQAGPHWAHNHTGQDFVVPTGTEVRAVTAGTVITSGWNTSYGWQIVIRLPDGSYNQYAHLSQRLVNAGDKVTTGQPIGRSGATGNVTGPHLHFEYRTSTGAAHDPIPWLRSHGLKP
ncbi:hypothetical protein GCM10023205_84900 [Yinghuangia aomiensis]|uniref:NlpC/P60 domain-containing protein n=2 Tax=Yinghuangia aomiensis TaxID=676205 RepID=A0ABP9IHM0_9ACTN